jgi:uncharacterized coiled-coil DUF342 family protein
VSEDRPAERRTFGQRLGKALGTVLRWLLRLLLILIIGAAVGIGIYFGAIYVYQQYIAPVQVHAIRLDILEAQQDEVGERLAARMDELQERVRGIEAQRDEDRQALAQLEGRVIAAATVQAAQAEALDQVDQVQADLAALRSSMADVAAAQENLRADVDAVRADQEAVRARLATVDEEVDSVSGDLASLDDDLALLDGDLDALSSELVVVQEEIDALAEAFSEQGTSLATVQERLSGATSPEALLRSLHVLTTMELLTRSRLLLVQNNVGLARTDIAAAQDRMIELQAIAPADQQDAIEEVIARLDAALESLPGSPVAAADALEGAWQLLLGGLPSGTAIAAEAGATPAPEVTPPPEATPTAEGAAGAEATATVAEPTPTVEATPTAEATPTPTPTPQS